MLNFAGDREIGPVPSSSTSKRKQSEPSDDASPSKRRRKTEQEKEQNRKKAEEKRVKKAEAQAFKASLVPWPKNPAFRFPSDMRKINKMKAKKQYKLNDAEMDTLERETSWSNQGYSMYLYSIPQVQALAKRKHGTDYELLPAEQRPRTESEQTEVMIKEYKAHLLKCLRCHVPGFDKAVSDHRPPQLGSTAHTLPDNYAHRPGRRVTELEAMNLFLLHRYELEGLTRETNSGPSPSTALARQNLHLGETLDYAEVQQRAMDVHGGFAKHNKIILDKARALVDSPWDRRWKWAKFPTYLGHYLAVDPKVVRRRHSQLKDRALIEVWWPPMDVSTDDFVLDVCAPGFCDGCVPEHLIFPEYASSGLYYNPSTGQFDTTLYRD